MNRLFTLLTIASALLLFTAGSAVAFPVSVNDTIYFDRTYGNTAGGQFDVSLSQSTETKRANSVDDYLFGTFCLEKNEHLDLSQGFKVAGISESAKNGGISGQSDENPSEDPISNSTKWLYWNFVTHKLDQKVSAYSYQNLNSANGLQLAIWRLEGEVAENNSVFLNDD